MLLENKKTCRTENEKKIIYNRINRIEGQLKGIKNMIEKDTYCKDVLTQLSAVENSVKSLSNHILENHLYNCVTRDLENGDYEMFGYCHLGDDEFAEFGSILLSELENIELPLGLSIEQDLYVPKRTDLMTAMIRDGMRVPDFIKDNYIASDRCNFESIIILQPNLTDEEKSKVVNDYKEYFKKISAQEVEVDDRGKRKLAYQIKDNTEGYFISYYFDAKEHDISDLEKQYRFDDNVIKFMTIKVSKVAEKVEDRNTMKLQRGEIYSYEDGLKQRVQEKITNEYNDFIVELKKERPEVIIERAYEKVCKEEMLYVFEKNDLSVNECKSLLKCSNILDDCSSEWLKSDGDFNEMLEYAVENSIEHITEDFKREQKQKNKDSR